MKGLPFFAISFCAVLLAAVSLRAENRFHVSETPLVAGDELQQITVLCDNDEKILGYSFGISVDPAVLEITDVTSTGTVAEAFDLDGNGMPDDADFFDGRFDAADGIVGYGVVFDIPDAGDGPRDLLGLEPGADRPIGKIQVNVIAAMDTTATITFEETQVIPAPSPPVKNVMTNTDGLSIYPDALDVDMRLTLVDGSIPIESRAPVITDFEGNQGLAGKVFQIIGEFFGEPDLSVMVCETRAEATLRGDGVTIDVTAPACGLTDWVPVEVCTSRGCDTADEGFFYESAPVPVITSIDPNQGTEGTQFTIVGENFDEGILTIQVCDQDATFDPPTDGGTRVLVTAPACIRLGAAEVEVCNSFGCASEPEGFTYLGDEPRFARGDVNSDNDINITDGINILNFLFLGGEAPACMDAADTDDTGDLVITDAVRIFNWLFTGGEAPSAPSPSVGSYLAEDCGTDTPAQDDLGCAEMATKCP